MFKLFKKKQNIVTPKPDLSVEYAAFRRKLDHFVVIVNAYEHDNLGSADILSAYRDAERRGWVNIVYATCEVHKSGRTHYVRDYFTENLIPYLVNEEERKYWSRLLGVEEEVEKKYLSRIEKANAAKAREAKINAIVKASPYSRDN